uniref:DNA-directed RNA polymerase n=1 Tax=Steinernema glaseri TaxID=37863 RepID=A0A1I8A8T8_9BILA
MCAPINRKPVEREVKSAVKELSRQGGIDDFGQERARERGKWGNSLEINLGAPVALRGDFTPPSDKYTCSRKDYRIPVACLQRTVPTNDHTRDIGDASKRTTDGGGV